MYQKYRDQMIIISNCSDS